MAPGGALCLVHLRPRTLIPSDRVPPRHVNAGMQKGRKRNASGLFVVCVRRCPTLPHSLGCSTIGAEGLSFRVRDGTGRFPFAVTAVTCVTQPVFYCLGCPHFFGGC